MELKLAWGIAGIICSLGAMYLIAHEEWTLASALVVGGLISVIHMERS